VLDPGEYLVVFASGKNVETYIDPAGYLHTDFSLPADGEFLALTDPDNVIIHEFAPQFPRQVFDVSYGLLPNTQSVTLIGDSHLATALVPTSGALDAAAVGIAPAWTLPSFNDATWATTIGGPGVGFDFGDDTIVNVANGTRLTTGLVGSDLTDADQNFELDGTIFGGGPANWPSGEEPPRALDNTVGTKWLAFQAAGSSYGFRFAGGRRHAITGYTITSANDAQNRDPYSWTLSGSNDGVNYTQVDARSAQTFAARFETRLYEFNNATAYEYYRFDFQTKFGVTGLESDRPSANAIQMAEIELFARGPVDFDPLVNLDVEAAWQPAQTSVYQRVEFDVADPASIVSLLLDLQYDDGFVAYLNGKRVAAANAPSLPNFQSNASGSRENTASLVPQSFDLSPHLGELVAGTNVLAIHVLNVNDASPDLLSRPRLVARQLLDDSLVSVYMSEPTPGAINVGGYAGLVETPTFSAHHGFYDAPFQLTIGGTTPNAEIYYTTDGSAPTPDNGTLYAGPLAINKTSTIRAQAFRDGYLPSSPITSTYLFVNDIVRQNHQATLNAGFPPQWGSVAPDYGMDPDVIGNFDANGNSLGGDRFGGIYAATIKSDLKAIPTLSLVMDTDDMFGPNGIYTNSTVNGDAWERATSVELIYPDGRQGFQIDAGVQMHGGAFRSHGLSKKHSLRLVFKGIYEGNTRLEFPFFGSDAAASFDTIVLRMDSNDGYAWDVTGPKAQYARDEWGRRSQAALGQPASHGERVHLYINGIYWGLYNPVERPDGSFAASYYGGEKEEWDAINTGQVIDGNLTAWNTLRSLSQAVAQATTETARTAAYMRVRGLNPDGTDNPSFDAYLDVVNYIDYLLVNYYGSNSDWPQRNWFAARRRGPESQGFVFHIWDYEWTLGLQSSVSTNRLSNIEGPTVPYGSLRSSLEFRTLFGDRVHRAMFNNGPLTSASSIARYQEIIGELPEAIVAESARWGDMHRSTPYTKTEWQREVTSVTSFLTNRNNVLLQQLRSAGLYPNVVAPTFSQHGGQVPADFKLTVTAPAGTIWYTLDGSDPRALGGAVNPTAIQYTGESFPVAGGMTVKARAQNGNQWSALNEAEFASNASALRITELHYNPAAFPGVADRQDIEFIELLNTGSQTIGLGGVQIAGFAGEPYTFTAGSALESGQRIIVARNPVVFQTVYGAGHNVASAGFAPRNLSNGGEQVTLLGPAGEVLQNLAFGDVAPWPNAPDGEGPSLEIIDPLGDASNAANWRASLHVGGSPGASGVPGDFDGNGLVDAADQVRWRGSFGLTVARGTSADGNRDGTIDAADYVVWRNAMAASAAGLAAATPATSVGSAPNVALPFDQQSLVRDAALTDVFAKTSVDRRTASRSNVTVRSMEWDLNDADALLLALPAASSDSESRSRSTRREIASQQDRDVEDVDKAFAELAIHLGGWR
jgi:hypothetical protein